MSLREQVNFQCDDKEVSLVLDYVCRLLPLKRHVLFLYDINRIDVVMVNVLASSAVDRGFK
jgi:hypothetical protein